MKSRNKRSSSSFQECHGRAEERASSSFVILALYQVNCFLELSRGLVDEWPLGTPWHGLIKQSPDGAKRHTGLSDHTHSLLVAARILLLFWKWSKIHLGSPAVRHRVSFMMSLFCSLLVAPDFLHHPPLPWPLPHSSKTDRRSPPLSSQRGWEFLRLFSQLVYLHLRNAS